MAKRKNVIDRLEPLRRIHPVGARLVLTATSGRRDWQVLSSKRPSPPKHS